ncbi:uncharacterized protein LOC124306598 isoform X2 [Neodiprion virginianus]|uniref:uncharacterized protein LOC124306598 isoform X2 n=1 Tax=Neodiprion virginianus TaxID=2961670 RepID=UPI001EE6C482|nr:uncharacterized protein LOC124306598 isoform X2 [Neodiprion virginianus]
MITKRTARSATRCFPLPTEACTTCEPIGRANVTSAFKQQSGTPTTSLANPIRSLPKEQDIITTTTTTITISSCCCNHLNPSHSYFPVLPIRSTNCSSKGTLSEISSSASRMVRNYKKKVERHRWSKVSMQAAIQAVLNGSMGYKRAATQFHVPRTTLERHAKKTRDSPESALKKTTPPGSGNRVFNEQQEAELVQRLNKMAGQLSGLELNELRDVAFRLARRNNLAHPFGEDGKAGIEWVRGFMARLHPHLALRRPDEATSMPRAIGLNKENKLVVRQKLDGKDDGSAKSNSSNYGGDSLWLKGDLEELFEAEDIQEIDEFEDSDRFEFEHQISDWSYLDEEGDEGTVTGAEEGDETVNYGGKGGEVVPSLRMLQQRGGSASASASASNGNMFPQQYCLRWKYHHSNLQTMFSQLLERQAYCDVTLACEGQTLRAHKVVLSACSTYFDTILSEYAERDPIVIMRDVKFADIKVLVDFMYKGEINIDHTRLSSLLKTAEDLHIKGLAEVSWRSDSVQNDMSNSGHSPGAATPGVETVLREGDAEESSPPKQRRRGRPPLDDPPSAHDVFTPKVTCVTGNVGSDDTFNEEMMSEGDHESWDGDMVLSENNETPLPVLSYMSKDDSAAPDDKKPSVTSNSNAPNPAIPEQFRDVVKMNDYLTTGRRQEFWEEPFTRRVMDAIKSKELEMKTAAEILGVSYGTLYGRYRDSYGCLKHPYSTGFVRTGKTQGVSYSREKSGKSQGISKMRLDSLDQLEKSGNLKFQKAYEPCSSERVRDFWAEPGPAEVLAKLRRKEITLFRAAEYLNVTVQTLATYLSTLQGPDRLSLSGELAGPISAIDGGSETENDAVNDILQKINANVASVVPNISTATPIKREGGGFVDVPTPITKAATSVLENNPDITIVKTESMPRKREYSKVPNSENNNAKLMSGGGVSELSQQKLSDSLSLNSDNIKP